MSSDITVSPHGPRPHGLRPLDTTASFKLDRVLAGLSTSNVFINAEDQRTFFAAYEGGECINRHADD